MKKLSIIGAAGGVGSTSAFYLGLCDLFEEIALVDVKRDLLLSHALDIEQAVGGFNGTKFTAGSWEEMAGSDLVLLVASAPQPKAASRNEFLGINLGIVRSAIDAIKKYCPKALVFTATCPTDVFNYLIWRELGGDRSKYIGFNRNDSVRLAWAAARVLGVPMHRVRGIVLGEHGETQVPIFSSITVDGKPANLSAAQIKEVGTTVANFFTMQVGLDASRSSTWLSPVSISCVLRAICTGKQEGPIPASTVMDGEYGISGVSLGMPLMLGPNGWTEIAKLPLTDEELAALKASGEHIKGLIAQCDSL